MYCAKPVVLALVFSLGFGSVAFAQRRGNQSSQSATEIHVYLRYTNEQNAGAQNQVELVNEGGVPVLQGFTDSQGQVLLIATIEGSFRLRVSGPEIETTLSERLNIDTSTHSLPVFVTVQPRGGTTATNSATNGNVMASTSQLKVPSTARKPYDKAIDAMQHKEFQKATELFQKAIDAYPQYDAAYDNLGVAFMQMGQTEKAGAAFQKAVELNDKNADANRNYSRYLIGIKQYTQAEEPLKRALMVAPQDPSSLTLLAIAEFQTKDYEGALQNALKVHQVSHDGYALAHFIAARVYELKQQAPSATAEYQIYLKESPNGPQAEQARAAVTRLTTNRPSTSAAQ